jgi:hypothetical protein
LHLRLLHLLLHLLPLLHLVLLVHLLRLKDNLPQPHFLPHLLRAYVLHSN